MATYRLPILASLVRQMAFAPLEVRHAQLAAAELLLDTLDPAKSYPSDFVTFRITGYQPKTRVEADLLTGLALQHDIGLMIEQVSEGMALCAADVAEPVLSIDDVTARFNVTSKTIQRWRRKGLVSRRFIFADGKMRVGFLLSSIERFVSRHSNDVREGANLTAISDDELAAMIRQARRLLSVGCTEAALTRRVARRFRRSALTVLHTLRKHDQLHPDAALLTQLQQELSSVRKTKIVKAYRRKRSLSRIARRVGCSKSAIYRIIMDDRLDRMSRRRVSFHDDELYHQSDAESVIRQIVRASEQSTPVREELRIPPRLPPYVADLYRTPLLTPAQERALFLELNWRKYRFVTARRQFDPEAARKRDLDRLESLHRAAGDVKNRIVGANLRLVVSVARKHVPGGGNSDSPPTLMDLVSEGNLILMRAAESFDVHRNVRFSTYATLALMKGFARLVPELRSRAAAGVDVGELELADRRGSTHHKRLADRDEVARLMKVLSPSERCVLSAHFGLEQPGRTVASRLTHDDLAAELGLTRSRIKQLEKRAMDKLREAAAVR